MKNKTKSTAEVAGLIKVSKDTLLRWLKHGLIKEPKRDNRGWRLFSEAEVQSIIKYAENQRSAAGSVMETSIPYSGDADKVTNNHIEDLDHISFNVHILSGIYRRANDLMRNIDGLQPQEAFDELLKYMSLKEILEKHDAASLSPFALSADDNLSAAQKEQAAQLRQYFAKHFHAMGKAASDLWKEGQFRLSDKCLIALHDLFQPLHFGSIQFDLRSAALREFLSPQTRKALGIFLTPDEVARLMVEVVSPTPQDRVCDPACGTATFLIEVLKYWQKHNSQRDKSKTSEFTVFGIDKNPRMLLLAELNLHNNTHCVFRSKLTDSLTKGNIKAGSCNAIFTNPPFGVNIEKKTIDLSIYEAAKVISANSARKIPSEILFLELCLRSLSPGGILAIVLPRSVVTNGTLDSARHIFDKLGHVFAIVALPAETFQATGTQTTTVLVFAKRYSQEDNRKDSVRICYAKVTNIGYDATGRKREGSQLTDLAKHMRECIEGQKESGICSLSIPVPKDETFSRLPTLLTEHSKRGGTLRLGDLLTLATCGRTPPRASYTPDGLFVVKVGNLTGNGIDWSPRDRNFVNPVNYKTNEDRWLKTNDILLTAAAHSPVYIAKKVDIVSAIPSEIGGKASFVGEVLLLRPDPDKIDPFVLLAYLRLPSVTKEIQALIKGQTAHLYAEDILNLLVDSAIKKPGEKIRKLAELMRLEAEQFAELNRTMFAQKMLAAELSN